MDNFAAENVRKKAESMLKDHAAVIGEFGAAMKLEGGAYYIHNDDTDDYIRFGYDVSNKFLTKLYGMSVKIVSHNIVLGADFEAMCIFTGAFRMEGVYFKRLKGDMAAVDRLNSQAALMNRIFLAAKKFDIESIRIKYCREGGILEVKIKPYAGAFVWIKFPPVTRKIPLQNDELEEIYHLTIFIQNCLSRRPVTDSG